MKNRTTFSALLAAILFFAGASWASLPDVGISDLAGIYKLEGVAELVGSRSAQRLLGGEAGDVADVIKNALADTSATIMERRRASVFSGSGRTLTDSDKLVLKSVLKEKLKTRFKEWIPQGAKKILYDDLFCSAVSKDEDLKELVELEKKIESALEKTLGEHAEEIASSIAAKLGAAGSQSEIIQALQNGRVSELALGAAAQTLSLAFGEAAVSGLKGRIEDVINGQLPPEALYYLRQGPEKFAEYSKKLKSYLPAEKLNDTVAKVRELILSRPVVVLPNSAYIAILSGSAAAHFAKGFASCPEACNWYEIKRGREVTKVLLWQAKAKDGVTLDLFDLVSIANVLAAKFGVKDIEAFSKVRGDLSKLSERFKKISDKLGEVDKFVNDKLREAQAAFDSSLKKIEGELLALETELTAPIKDAVRDLNAKAGEKFSKIKEELEKLDKLKDISVAGIAKKALEDSGILDEVAADLASLNDKIAGAAADAVAELAVDAGLVKSEALLKEGEKTPALNESISSELDPVRLHNGEFIIERTDLGSNCRGACLEFKRSYRSRGDIDGPLGRGWMFNLAERLLFASDGSVVWLDPRGRKFIFKLKDVSIAKEEVLGSLISSPYLSADGISGGLYSVDAKGRKFFVLYFSDGVRSVFDDEGRLLSKADPSGNSFKLFYARGNLVSAADSRGFNLEFFYDANGRMIRVKDSVKRTLDLAFDSFGRLSASSLKLSGVSGRKPSLFSYFYDDDGLLDRVIDPKGHAYLQNRYAKSGAARDFLVWQRFGSGDEMTVSYELLDSGEKSLDAVASRAYVTGRDNVVRIYEHNFNGNLINEWVVKKDSVTSPVIFKRYDRDGNIVKKIYPDGRYVKYLYDSGAIARRGRLVEIKECAAGDVKAWRFDDKKCRTATFEYSDAKATPVALINAIGRVELSQENERDKETTPLASLSEKLPAVEFDQNGNISSEELGAASADIEYDELDRVSKMSLTVSGVLKDRVEAEYNAAGMLGRVRIFSETESFERDELGRVVKIVKAGAAGSAVERFSYDSGSRIVAYEDADHVVTEYFYNDFGELISTVCKQAKMEFVRDAIGRVVEKRCIDLSNNDETCLVRFEYEGASAKIKNAAAAYWTDDRKNKIWISADKDELNPLRKVAELPDFDSVASAEPKEFDAVYDGEGRIVKLIDRRGNATTFEYAAGRLPVAERLANGNERRFFYDERGRLSGIKRFDSSFLSIEYNDLGRVKEIALVANGVRQILQAFSYDAFGNLATSVDYNDPLDSSDDVKSFYRYDSLGGVWAELSGGKWMSASRDFANGGLNVRYPSGRVVKGWAPRETDTGSELGNDRKFTLDSEGRLVREDFAGGYESWAFDDASNFVSRESGGKVSYFETDEVNAYRKISSNVGSNATELFYDKNGDLISDGTFNFEFDPLGRLTKIKSAANKELVARYFYDAANRRVKKNTSSGEINYSYFGADVVRAQDGNGAFAEFVYSEGIDRLLSVFTGEAGELPVSLDKFNNAALIGGGDSGGLLLREFGPYGEVRKEVSSGFVPPLAAIFGFASREEDAESGLYYFRNRYFSPRLGRFISYDPLGVAGGANRYAYVGGRVTKYSDPLGLFALRYHESLTSATLAAYGLGNIETAVLLGNFGTDIASVPKVYRAFLYSKDEHERAVGMHFDNLSNYAEIKNTWAELLKGVTGLNESPAITTPEMARGFALELGSFMHQAQDFYAHSNWVEYWNERGKFGAEIPTFLGTTIDASAELYTGAWGSGANPKCPKHHDQMAKDDPENRLFTQAMLAAQSAGSELLSMISNEKRSQLASFKINNVVDSAALATMRNLAAAADKYNSIRRKK